MELVNQIPTSTLRQEVNSSTVELPFYGVKANVSGHEAMLIFDKLEEEVKRTTLSR